MSEPWAETDEVRDRRIARLLLGAILAGALLFLAAFVPRVTNVNFGDVEFTGWSGPLGSRLLAGERPYEDFVLPIPPGSFALIAVLEKLSGRPLLLHELWLNAVTHLGMGALAYVMARAFTTRKVAVLTALATFAIVIQLNKECAYDHTAQLVAWSSIAAGMWAQRSGNGRLWAVAGALASMTLAFKQSTALGAVFGWLLGFAYLAGVELLAGQREAARALRVPLARYLGGVGWGLLSVWLFLLLLGGTARGFVRAVFLDASTLKGGFSFLVRNLTTYLLEHPAFPASLGTVAAGVAVGARLLHQRGTLHVGDERERTRAFSTWEIALVAVAALAGVGGLGVVLLLRIPAYPDTWVAELDRLKLVPTTGLLVAALLFAVHLVRPGAPPAPGRPDPVRAGHALNASLLAALACSLMHNTSAPEFRPFYDNNAIVPLSLALLFVVLDRARLPLVSAAFLLAFVVSIAGNKYFRAMHATLPAGRAGHWAGMRVGEHALSIVEASLRVRQLTTPEETVLVLPEDLQIEALIGRPRPPLLGAIVFVDQYAPRLADEDLARLDEHLPKVIVVHPRRRIGWQRFFRIWSGTSGAERVVNHVLDDLLPRRYRRDGAFPTTYIYEPGTLEIWVRLEPGEEPRPVEEADPVPDGAEDEAAP